MSFADDMTKGGQAREQGDFAEALARYNSAIECAPSVTDGYEASIQFAVTLRLAGALERSLGVFRSVLESMGEEVSLVRARCHRDYGMALLERYLATRDLTFVSAHSELQASIDMYDTLGDAIEAAISRGFLGRYYLATGNRRQAVRLLRSTHHQIRYKNDSGERDNLVWVARASLLWRWCYAKRALKVTADTRRRKEYVVLLVGGETLYNWLRARQQR